MITIYRLWHGCYRSKKKNKRLKIKEQFNLYLLYIFFGLSYYFWWIRRVYKRYLFHIVFLFLTELCAI